MRGTATHAAAAALLAGLGLVAPAPAGAQGFEAGRAKAQQLCGVCHGPLGVSSAPDAPHLAGQPAMYLTTQLRAYRSGARRHEVMGVIAKGLSDEDIAAVVAFYSAIRIEATAP